MMHMGMLNLGHKALHQRIEMKERKYVFFHFYQHIGFYSMFGRELNCNRIRRDKKFNLMRTA